MIQSRERRAESGGPRGKGTDSRLFALSSSRSAFGLALLSAVLLVLAFPDFNWWLLAWVALVPLLLALIRYPLSLKQSFLLGEITGAGYFYGTCYWITYSMIHYGGIPSGLAYLMAIIPAVVLGALVGLVVVGVRLSIRRLGVVGVLSAPPLWVLAEWLRPQMTGIGWNALGYSQAFHPRAIQMAEYVGVYGVSFILVLTSALITRTAWLLKENHPEKKWPAMSWGVFCGGLCVLATVVGLRPQSVSDSGSTMRVLAIQPNIPVRAAPNPQADADSLDRLVQQTEAALAAHGPTDLIIWPESSLNIFLKHSPEVQSRLARLVQLHRVYLLLSVLGWEEPDRVFNSAAILAPNGQAIGEYRKTKLLPFGEYVPLRGIVPFIDRVPALAGDFETGTTYPVMDIGAARVGGFICSEAMFSDIARALVREGATMLVNISNYGWFGPTPAPRQHLAHVIFRAVETRRHLFCVTNTGISAHITPAGELRSETDWFEPAVRRWIIPSPPSEGTLTFYARHGDVFVLGCAILAVILLVKRKQVKR